MGTKRIINMNATTDFESDDNIVVDSETAGTRKMAQSVLKEKLREDCLAGIHNLTPATDFATGDTIVVDNATDGPRGMNKDVLLAKTAENALGSIKNLATSITAFRTGDVIPVDGPSGTAKMPKDDLLRVTAENAAASGLVALPEDVASAKRETTKILSKSGTFGFNDIPFTNKYALIHNGTLSINDNSFFNFYVIPVVNLVSIKCLAGTEGAEIPAVFYGTSSDPSSYIEGSEQYAPGTGSSIEQFEEALVIPDTAVYAFVSHRFASQHYPDEFSIVGSQEISFAEKTFELQDKRLSDFNSSAKLLVEDDTQKGKIPVADMGVSEIFSLFYKDVTIDYSSADKNMGVYGTNHDHTSVSFTSTNNWFYVCVPVHNLTSVTTWAGNYASKVPAVFYGTTSDPTSFIPNSDQYYDGESTIGKFDGELVIPANAKYAFIQFNIPNGTSSDFEIVGSVEIEPHGYYTLASDGTGDFTTLEEAETNAPSYAIIYVKSGEYSQLKSNGVTGVTFNKNHKYIGYDKDSVIFSHYNGVRNATAYVKSGHFENITWLSGYDALVTPTRPSNPLSYACHLDGFTSTNFTISFVNCKFISYWNTCAGCGMDEDVVLEFKNCDFDYRGQENPLIAGEEGFTDMGGYPYKYACVSCHNTDRGAATKSGKIKILCCTLRSDNVASVMVQNSVVPTKPTTWELVGNAIIGSNGKQCVYSSIGGLLAAWDSTGANLDSLSYNNNVELLNN